MISIQLIYVIATSVQEFGDLRQLLIHFLEHEDRDSRTLADIKNHLKPVSEDIHARIIQYQTDGLYFEALYLSRRLFDLWGTAADIKTLMFSLLIMILIPWSRCMKGLAISLQLNLLNRKSS